MKVLVTGIKGQLGHDVMQCLAKREIESVGADIEEFDITDFKATRDFIVEVKPDVVIHCSAYTAVEKAEDDMELCMAVNGTGTKNIAAACKELDSKMLYISSDYVFPGVGENFYEVTDTPNPLGKYGETKQAGEEAVKKLLDKYFIVRTSWVFGKNGSNFVKTMLRLGKEKKEIHVVNDQIGSPTYTKDLAPLLCDMILTEKYGIYHATNEGICSWAEFAEEIMKIGGLDAKVNGISSEQYPSRVTRPKNSRLSKKSLDENGFKRLPDWKDAVKRYIEMELM